MGGGGVGDFDPGIAGAPCRFPFRLVTAAQERLEVDHTDRDALLGLLRGLRASNQFYEARWSAGQALRKAPDDSQLLAEQGEIEYALGCHHVAGAAFEEALSADHNNVHARAALAAMYQSLRRYRERQGRARRRPAWCIGRGTAGRRPRVPRAGHSRSHDGVGIVRCGPSRPSQGTRMPCRASSSCSSPQARSNPRCRLPPTSTSGTVTIPRSVWPGRRPPFWLAGRRRSSRSRRKRTAATQRITRAYQPCSQPSSDSGCTMRRPSWSPRPPRLVRPTSGS